MSGWVTGAAAVLLAAACWTDLRRMIIPNRLTGGFAAAALLFHAVNGGWTGLLAAVTGGAAGMLPLLLLYRLQGIGAGDIKWFGAFGTWTGAMPALQLLVYSILLAGGISLVLLLLRVPGIRAVGVKLPWPWGEHPVHSGRKAVFPFMLAVVPGFAWLMGGSGFGQL